MKTYTLSSSVGYCQSKNQHIGYITQNYVSEDKQERQWKWTRDIILWNTAGLN